GVSVTEDVRIELINDFFSPTRRVYLVNSNAPNMCAVTVANFDGRLRTKQRHRDKDYGIRCNPRDTDAQRLGRKSVVFLCELDSRNHQGQSGSGNHEERDNDCAETRIVMYGHGSASWCSSISVRMVLSSVKRTAVRQSRHYDYPRHGQRGTSG